MKMIFKILTTIVVVCIILSYIIVTSIRCRRNEFVKYWYFQNNLKRLKMAVSDFASDNSGCMPAAATWADQVIKHNNLIFKDDFVSPASYSSCGIAYNEFLENKQCLEIKEETVVLFMAKEGWNAHGGKSLFYKYSTNRKHSYLITFNGDIYRHNPDTDHFVRLRDSQVVESEDLYWE